MEHIDYKPAETCGTGSATYQVEGIAFTLRDLYASDRNRRLNSLQAELARTWTYLDEDLPPRTAAGETTDETVANTTISDAEYQAFISYIREHRLSYAYSDIRRLDHRSRPSDRVVRFADIDYCGDGARPHRLDVYLPKEAYLRGDGDIPVIFNIHGGAFFYSFKEIQQAYATVLAERGFAVVCPNYTLAPGGDFLTQLADVSQALGWLREHAADWQLSREQTYLVCDSAGALLGTFLLACETNDALASLLGTPSSGTKFNAVGFVSGMLVYDHLFDSQYPDSGELFDRLRPMFLPLMDRLSDTRYERTSALMEDIAYPPVWLSTSTDDFLECDSLYAAMRLRVLGVDHELHNMRSMNGRRIPHDYPLMTWDSGSAQLNDAMVAFFREHLTPRTTLTSSV